MIFRAYLLTVLIPCYSQTKAKPRRSTFKKSGKVIFSLTGNPYSAIIPFYSIKDGKKVINKGSGINSGLQRGHTKKTSEYKEAYITHHDRLCVFAAVYSKWPSC